jgi:hypothetical protein
MGKYIYDIPTTHYATIEDAEGFKYTVCCISFQQALDELKKAEELWLAKGREIADAYITEAGKEKKKEKPFTHYRVLYKSSMGGNIIVFIPKEEELESALDALDDNAGIIDISEVTRTFTTRSRLIATFDSSRNCNMQNSDTDAQHMGLRYY